MRFFSTFRRTGEGRGTAGRTNPNTRANLVRTGSLNRHAKVGEESVRNIRASRASGTSAKDLATFYGLSERTVRDIVNRVIWKHVA